MRQLWIDGKRMDGIPFLRHTFSEAPLSEQPALCHQLLEQSISGALEDWLSAQPELHAVTSRMAAMDTVPLTALRDSLRRDETPAPQLLGILCGIPGQSFAAIQDSFAPASLAQERQHFLERFPWWETMAPRMMTIADWSNVVTDQSQWSAALAKYRKSSHCTEAPETIYLCNTGSSYVLDLAEGDRGLRLIGCGTPRLWLNPRRYCSNIDFQRRGLYLEDLTLRVSKATRLTGTEHYWKNVTTMV